MLELRIMSGGSDFNSSLYGESYVRYQTKKRSWLRQLVRSAYLREVLKHVTGPAIDFGCGTGELLELLPKGSMGLEINPAAVKFCREKGLNVVQYDTEIDAHAFSFCKPGAYSALILSHVLEHLDEPDKALQTMIRSCARLGIGSIVVVVPGKKGFAFDRTHRTFVSELYLKQHALWHGDHFRMVKRYYFPVNLSWFGNAYAFNEMHVLYSLV